MVKTVYRQAIILILIASLIAFLVGWKKAPVGIITGGIIALLNFKGLAWGVNGFLTTDGARGKLIFLSLLRILVTFLILAFIIFYKLVDALGLLLGLSTVFVLILKEGLLYNKSR